MNLHQLTKPPIPYRTELLCAYFNARWGNQVGWGYTIQDANTMVEHSPDSTTPFHIADDNYWDVEAEHWDSIGRPREYRFGDLTR